MKIAPPLLKLIVPILSSPPTAGAAERLVIDFAEKNEDAAVVPEACLAGAAKGAGREIGRVDCLAWMMMTSNSHLQIFVLGRRPCRTRAKQENEREIAREIRLAWVMMTSNPQRRNFVLGRRPCLTRAEGDQSLERFPLLKRRCLSGERRR